VEQASGRGSPRAGSSEELEKSKASFGTPPAVKGFQGAAYLTSGKAAALDICSGIRGRHARRVSRSQMRWFWFAPLSGWIDAL